MRLRQRRLVAAACSLVVIFLCVLPALHAQQVNPSYYSALRWRLIGPYRAGNVYAVAGVPGDPTTYYLGLPEGGVWKTTDGGTVWFPIFDQEHVPSIGSVAVADSAPNVVYVGTGDPTFWSFTPGEGVFKSTDGGKSWQRIGLADTQYIPALLVDPRNPNVVLAGALGPRGFGPEQKSSVRGVYRTSDGGRTWTHTLFVDAESGVEDMAWDYRDPKVVYAAFSGGGGRGPQRAGAPAPSRPILYKSTDEGKSWKPLSQAGLPANLRTATIAVAAGTRGRIVYAEVQGFGRDAQGLYRSDDGGKSWRLATHDILSAGGRIYVDPQNPDIVYLMGTALYRSTDGGRSVTAIKGAPGGDDYRDFWIDPNNPRRMIAGVDQGPTITVDGGETWTPWFNLPNGQFYHISTDNQFPYWVYGAQQDSGTAGVRSRSDYGDIGYRDWYPVGGFEAGYIEVDPLNPRWIFTQGWYHALRRFDRETGQVAVVYTPHGKDRFASQPPMAFSPQDPHTLYMGAQYLLATDDGGRHWRALSPDLTVRPEPKAKAGARPQGRRFAPPALESLSPSPVAAGEIWTGSSNGVIELTRDGGQTWQNVSPPGLDASTAIEILDASHHDAGTAYAAAMDFGKEQPYLYRTTDFGRTWQSIVNGLPEHVRTRSIREDPRDPNLLFAGTEMGVWVSFDKGDHWQSLQLNLPNTVVSDLAVHDNDLAISTYGRSLWILDDITPLREAAAAEAAPAAYLYPPETALRVRWSNNHDTPLPPEMPAGENPPEGAILDYYLKAPAAGTMTLGIYDAAGNLVRQYTNAAPPPYTSQPNVAEYWFQPPAVLSGTAGMHRFVWNLRYPDPKALTYSYFGQMLDYTEYTLTWHAVKGHTPRRQPVGPLAIPGRYDVRLTVNGQTYTQPLELVNDPRVPISETDLEAQLAAEQRVERGLDASYNAFYTISDWRKKLAAELRAAPASGKELAAQGKAVDGKLEALIRGTGNSGFGAANRDLARRLQDLEFGDLRPNASLLAAIQGSCEQIEAAKRQLEQLATGDLPRLNSLLTAAGQGALAAPAATGGCGQ